MVKLSANKKKVIVLASMVVLLVVAGTLNFVLNSKLPEISGDNGDVTTTFFSAHRATRESRRAEQLSYLDSIINSENSTAEAIAAAEKEKLELCANIETETTLEGLIKAQGYSDAVVTIGGENINIVVNKAQLDKDDYAVIYTIVLDSTEFTADHVAVMPYASV